MSDLGNRRWRTTRARVLRDQPQPCVMCGKPIDYTRTGTDPQAPSVDHVTPRAHGGAIHDPNNLRVVHFGCNSSRGARTSRRTTTALDTSRDW